MRNVATTSGAAPGGGLQSGGGSHDISERSPLTVRTPTHPPAHTDYVHMATSTSPRIHTNLHVCLYTAQACPVCVCLCVHVYSDVCVRTYDPYTYGHACMHRCTCLHVCSDVCIHAYDPYIYGYAYVHRCTCSDAQAWTQTLSRPQHWD